MQFHSSKRVMQQSSFSLTKSVRRPGGSIDISYGELVRKIRYLHLIFGPTNEFPRVQPRKLAYRYLPVSQPSSFPSHRIAFFGKTMRRSEARILMTYILSSMPLFRQKGYNAWVLR